MSAAAVTYDCIRMSYTCRKFMAANVCKHETELFYNTLRSAAAHMCSLISFCSSFRLQLWWSSSFRSAFHFSHSKPQEICAMFCLIVLGISEFEELFQDFQSVRGRGTSGNAIMCAVTRLSTNLRPALFPTLCHCYIYAGNAKRLHGKISVSLPLTTTTTTWK